MEILTLDYGGIILAIAIGVAMVWLSGGLWYLFLSLMIIFLALSAIATYIGLGYKRKLGLGQAPRGIKNVVANGAVPLAMAIVYRLAITTGHGELSIIAVMAFVASVAAITADKFGSEIGVFDAHPWSLVGGRMVKRGTSGAVSPLGLGASLLGSFLIVLTAAVTYPILGGMPLLVFFLAFAGFFGGVVDSLLGYYEERDLGNKYTSNLFCSLAGAVLVMLVMLLLR